MITMMINISNDPWDPPYPPLTFSPCQSGAATLLNLRPETAEDHDLGGEDERANNSYSSLYHSSIIFEYSPKTMSNIQVFSKNSPNTRMILEYSRYPNEYLAPKNQSSSLL